VVQHALVGSPSPGAVVPASAYAGGTVVGQALGGSRGGSTSTSPTPARGPTDQEAPGVTAGLGRAGRRGVLRPHLRHLDVAPVIVSAMMGRQPRTKTLWRRR
jgi:hypothetical protein